jgi:peptide-methionine (S)-S-oxide reductase
MKRLLLTCFALMGIPAPARAQEAEAIFAGGCFWGVQWVFEHVKGVTGVVSGYSGGTVANPTYELVGTGRTGHAEAVRVTYDSSIVSYRDQLEIFFLVAHDPTTRDRQGPDVGSDYRAIVFARDSAQLREVTSYVAELTARREFANPIVTELRLRQPFHVAEAYHQRYAALHPDEPYIVTNDAPKIVALQNRFPRLYRAR